MIKNSMEDDLRNEGTEGKNSGKSAAEVLAEKDSSLLYADDSEKEIIKDEYSGNIAYRNNDALPADPVPEEKKEAESPGFETEKNAAGAERADIDKAESGEEKKDLAASLVESPAMLALQKNLQGIQKTRKRRFGKNNLFIGMLLSVVVIFSVFWFTGKDGKNDDSDASENAAAPQVQADPFASVKNRNDAARMRSVTAIANILAVYHLEEKADLPVTGGYVKLSEDNPVSELLKDALKRYGKDENILQDPDGDDNYYAYRSDDGVSFEISAKLEDRESNSCKDDPCIFKKALGEKDFNTMILDLEQYK